MRFGQKVVNTCASPDNPRKYAIYVKTVVRSGKVNPGKYYELTDGKGHFWQTDFNIVKPIEEPTQ